MRVKISLTPEGLFTTVDVPHGITLGDDHFAVQEYGAARTLLNTICGSRFCSPEDLTPSARAWVEQAGGIAGYYEEHRPDIVDAWNSLQERLAGQNIEHAATLVDSRSNEVPIFTFQQ